MITRLHQLCTIWAFILFSMSLVGQEIITGTVYDADANVPLVGANVVLKGTSKGTVTDIDGKYEIRIDSLNRTLVFSYIGCERKEVIIDTQKQVDVRLSPSQAILSEVIVQAPPPPPPPPRLLYSVEEIISPESVARSGLEFFKRRKAAPEFHFNPEHNTEGYATIRENGFKSTSKNPLSTFSVDVDGAAYSNMRRFLNRGVMPHKDVIRIEEMINYFTYDYASPKENKPFELHTELSTCPWNENNLLLHVGVQGKKLDLRQLPPSNLVFLLDVSGSMQSPNKLPLLKSSLKLLLEQLRPEDRVAIVVYAGSAGLVLPSTSGRDRETILNALESLRAGGSTAGGAGLKLAYKIAAENFMEEGNNRIILATDGDFNVGVSSNAEMERLVEKERERGTAISVLGFGMGNYKDDKMEIIANKGNGNYSYIDNLLEAKKVLVTEFGGTFHTIAKDVKLQLEFNPKHVAEYRLIGYENRLLDEEDFDNDKVDAGEIGSGHSVTALYEIVPTKNARNVKGNLKYQTSTLTKAARQSQELLTLNLRYKTPKGTKSKLIEQVIKNQPIAANKVSTDYSFSAAVAMFGMMLRKSEHKGSTTWNSTWELAKSAAGKDPKGYRSEMIQLIESAEILSVSLTSD